MCGVVFAFVVGRIISLVQEGRGGNVIIWLIAGVCGMGALFVIAWLALSLQGWLVWAVIALCLCSIAFAVGWLLPQIQLGE